MQAKQQCAYCCDALVCFLFLLVRYPYLQVLWVAQHVGILLHCWLNALWGWELWQPGLGLVLRWRWAVFRHSTQAAQSWTFCLTFLSVYIRRLWELVYCHTLGLNILEALGLSTLGLGFKSVCSLVKVSSPCGVKGEKLSGANCSTKI